MAKKKICVIGRFDRGLASDGQTIKTIEIINEITARYGKDEVRQVSYLAIKDSRLQMLRAVWCAFAGSRKVVIISRAASVGNLIRACTLINRVFHRPVFQILIGGALPDAVRGNPGLKPILAELNAIFVETQTQRDALADLGVDRVCVMPNFKNIRLYTESELPRGMKPPYPLVFMSRVSGDKGVREMIDTIRKINSDKLRYTLDIYGMLNLEFEEEFNELSADFPDYIRYHGLCDAWKTSEKMHDYFLHLLPTKCPTEGQPGSVIDSFFAGLPILCGRWQSCAEMIPEGVAGISFTLGDFDEFERILRELYDHPERVDAMRSGALAQASKFVPENAMNALFEMLEKDK